MSETRERFASPVRPKFLLTLALLWLLQPLQAPWADGYRLPSREIAPGVYALIGDTDGRTYENHGLNNNLGFIVTDAGVLLIDSGATPQGAVLIEEAVRAVTDKPVRWVVNTGSQDHRWLGNSHFAEQGAEIIALRRTVETQRRYAAAHTENLGRILRERADGVHPVYAAPPLEKDRALLERGGKRFELIWPGDAHFPGDAIVWLPEERIVFTGDLVYVDRMLGVLPESPVLDWQRAFAVMAALQPAHLVPGHGEPSDMEQAARETGDYLDWLIEEVGARIDDWKELDETVEELSDAPAFRHLRHYDSWHKTNVNRTYLQLEAIR